MMNENEGVIRRCNKAPNHLEIDRIRTIGGDVIKVIIMGDEIAVFTALPEAEAEATQIEDETKRKDKNITTKIKIKI